MSLLVMAGCALALIGVAGCSRRDAPPDTPTVAQSEQTPTYRSTTNSYEANNAPRYTQPGQNSGRAAPLPVLPTQNRFDQNTPLAMTVYNALQQSAPLASRYITVDTKGSVVRLAGTASASDKSAAAKAAQSVPGVTKVLNTIQVR